MNRSLLLNHLFLLRVNIFSCGRIIVASNSRHGTLLLWITRNIFRLAFRVHIWFICTLTQLISTGVQFDGHLSDNSDSIQNARGAIGSEPVQWEYNHRHLPVNCDTFWLWIENMTFMSFWQLKNVNKVCVCLLKVSHCFEPYYLESQNFPLEMAELYSWVNRTHELVLKCNWIISQLSVQGANSHGQLGLGYHSEMCTTPQMVEFVPFDLKNIKRIAGGGGHTFALDACGCLYACGWNHKGQLAIGNTKDVSNFVEVPTFCSSIVEIACGWDSSAAIDADGLLYVWGSNAFCQLGMYKRCMPFSDVPIKLELPHNRKPAKIGFGLQYLVILCTDNVIYFVGRIKFREKCTSFVHENVKFYKLNETNLHSIDHIASGTYHIVFASNATKTVSGVGDNRFNQIQSMTFNAEIRKLCCGWTHNGVLTSDGNVFLYGRNSYGQLAHNDVSVAGLVQLECEDGCVDDLHLGSEHGMVQTKSGSIKTWGWNEHGNCGHGNEINMCVYGIHRVSSLMFTVWVVMSYWFFFSLTVWSRPQ